MNGFADLLSRVPAEEREEVAGVVEVTPRSPEATDSDFDVVLHRATTDERARLWLVAVKTHPAAQVAATAERLQAARALLHEQPAAHIGGELNLLTRTWVEALLGRALDKWMAAAHHDAGADFVLVISPARVPKPSIITAHSLGSVIVNEKWIESAALVKALDRDHVRRALPTVWEPAWRISLGSSEERDGLSVLEDMHAPLTAEDARAVSRWFRSPAATPKKLPPRP